MKKTLIALAASAVVAIGSVFALDVPVADAVAIAMDKERAKAACVQLIDLDKQEDAAVEAK